MIDPHTSDVLVTTSRSTRAPRLQLSPLAAGGGRAPKTVALLSPRPGVSVGTQAEQAVVPPLRVQSSQVSAHTAAGALVRTQPPQQGPDGVQQLHHDSTSADAQGRQPHQGNQHAQAPQHVQPYVWPQQQQQPQPQQPQQQPHVPAAGWASPGQQQQQVRPLHAQRHVQHMTRLVLSCDNLLKLQAVLSIHLHQFTPSCITAAMRQLHNLRRQEQQAASSGCSSPELAPVLQAVQLQLAGQLTQALVQQLPMVSGSCLAAFLAAAASMQLVMPAGVLEQIAGHLVNRALREACHTHSSAGAAASHQSSDASAAVQQQLQPGDSHAAGAQGSSQQQQQQQQQQQPHVAALSAWVLAKLRLRSEPLWGELVSIAGEQLAAMTPNDCVLLAYACAKAGQHQSRLYSRLQQQLLPHAARLPPESISCLLWSYAAAGQYHHGLVSALAGAAADKMERFSGRDLATSAWACGHLRHADARMLSALRVQALACMSDMQHQALSNLAWSLATLGLRDEALTAAVVGRAAQLADGFHMQGLANVAWAVVKLQQQLKHSTAPASTSSSRDTAASTAPGYSSSLPASQQRMMQPQQRQLLQACRDLLQVLCSAALGRLNTGTPQEVCNLLWACATLQHRHEPFLTAAAGRLAAVAEECAPIDLAQALWALQTLGFRRKLAQQALLQSALNRLHLFGPQALSNLSWAVASSGMQYPRGLPAAVAQQLQALLPQMTPQGLATTLWALSKMGHVPQQLVHAASSHIRPQLPLYNAQDLCNVAMVAAKARYREPQLLQGLAAAASSAAALTLGAAGGSSNSSSTSSIQQSPLVADAGEASLSPPSVPAAPGVGSARHRLTATGVCNLVWAFAGTGWCDAQLMQQLQQVAVLHLSHLQPRNIAALCQGFALLGQPFEQLLAALQETPQTRRNHKGQRLQQQQQQQQQQQPPLQYQQHQQHLQGLQARLGGQAAAYGQLELHARHLSGLLSSWPADSLALLLHALVITDAHDAHPILLVAALRQLSHKVAKDPVSQQRHCQLHMALTCLALQWGCASVAEHGQGALRSRHTTLQNQHTSSSGGSSSAPAPSTGAGPSSLVQDLFRGALAAEATDCCAGPDACLPCQPGHGAGAAAGGGQAAAGHTASLALGAAAEGVAQPQHRADAGPLLTGPLAQLCLKSWQQQEAVRQLSRVEQEVAAVLASMGLQPLSQHWLQLTYTQHTRPRHVQSPAAAAAGQQWTSRALAVNVGLSGAVLGEGRRPIALCALPPAALSSSTPRQVLGQTLLEHRCLQAAGWQVVWFSWDDWDSLAGSHSQQQALLSRLCGL